MATKKLENTTLGVSATNGGPQATKAKGLFSGHQGGGGAASGGRPLFSQRQSGIDARNNFRNAATTASVLTQFAPNFLGSKDGFYQRRQDRGLRSVRNQTVLHYGIRQKMEEQQARERDSQRRFLANAARIAIAEKNMGLNFQSRNEQARLAGERLGLQQEALEFDKAGDVKDRERQGEMDQLKKDEFKERYGDEAKEAEEAKAFDDELGALLRGGKFTIPSLAKYGESKDKKDLVFRESPDDKLGMGEVRMSSIYGALRSHSSGILERTVYSKENLASEADRDLIGEVNNIQRREGLDINAADDPEIALRVGLQAMKNIGMDMTGVDMSPLGPAAAPSGPEGTNVVQVDEKGRPTSKGPQVGKGVQKSYTDPANSFHVQYRGGDDKKGSATGAKPGPPKVLFDRKKAEKEIRTVAPGISDDQIKEVSALMGQGVPLDVILSKGAVQQPAPRR